MLRQIFRTCRGVVDPLQIRDRLRWRGDVFGNANGLGWWLAILSTTAALVAVTTAHPMVAQALLIMVIIGLILDRCLQKTPATVSERTPDHVLEDLNDVHWRFVDNEARYLDLLDTQNDLIIRRNSDGRVMFANQAVAKTFGVRIDDIVGQPFSLRVLGADEGDDAEEPGHGNCELLMTVDGPRWFSWTRVEAIGLSGEGEVQDIGRDVTDQRRVTAALSHARDAAEAANHAKSRFLATMSHEIRTPMNGILGMSSLLRETSVTHEQRDYIDAVEHSARALLGLIDEVLDFSKIEAGHLELNAKPFQLKACVDQVARLMRPRAASKQLSFEVVIVDPVPDWVMGDQARVRQILLNLLSNAVKFTDSGGVVLAVRVDTDAEDCGGDCIVVVEVEDTGIGLRDQAIETLFVEFEQGALVAAKHLGGTGLGLAISRRLARAMGGELSAACRPEGGSRFTLSLPLARALTAAPEQSDSRVRTGSDRVTSSPADAAKDDGRVRDFDAAPAQGWPRVLIAEDNAVNALLARRIIERDGGAVVVVRNGAEAVAELRHAANGVTGAYDMVLMDVFMPVMDGLDATRRIRRDWTDGDAGSQPEIPIIALTANAFAEDQVKCREAGMSDYLAKPFDPEQLRAVMRRWVNGFQDDGFEPRRGPKLSAGGRRPGRS